jgi:hypothetical protein
MTQSQVVNCGTSHEAERRSQVNGEMGLEGRFSGIQKEAFDAKRLLLKTKSGVSFSIAC